MKHATIYACLCVCVVLLVVGCGRQQGPVAQKRRIPIPVPNASFEEVRDRFPAGWTPLVEGSAHARADRSDAHTGEHSVTVRLWGDGARGGARTTLGEVWRGEYEVSFWAVADLDETAAVGAELAGQETGVSTVGDEWTRCTWRITLRAAAHDAPLCVFSTPPGRKVWFDDAEVVGVGYRHALVDLTRAFAAAQTFWEQGEIAERIAGLGDARAIMELERFLEHQDRHVRSNAAFVLARLGDRRGFEAISAVLQDKSDRAEGQGVPGGDWTVEAQIRSDRYYAVHVLATLRGPRALPILLPLLGDPDVSYKAAWALGEIGDDRAAAPLIEILDDRNPSVRVIAIRSLEKLGATSALPRLRSLLGDARKAAYGEQVTVAQAAWEAIAKLEESAGAPPAAPGVP